MYTCLNILILLILISFKRKTEICAIDVEIS